VFQICIDLNVDLDPDPAFPAFNTDLDPDPDSDPRFINTKINEKMWKHFYNFFLHRLLYSKYIDGGQAQVKTISLFPPIGRHFDCPVLGFLNRLFSA